MDEFQQACSPISNWQFTLGRGIETGAVTGIWGSLSKVTGPFAADPDCHAAECETP